MLGEALAFQPPSPPNNCPAVKFLQLSFSPQPPNCPTEPPRLSQAPQCHSVLVSNFCRFRLALSPRRQPPSCLPKLPSLNPRSQPPSFPRPPRPSQDLPDPRRAYLLGFKFLPLRPIPQPLSPNPRLPSCSQALPRPSQDLPDPTQS